MNTSRVELKTRFINQILISVILSFILVASSYAQPGCCSRHGGVASCNAATGYLQCRDGAASPSCRCNGTTAKPKPVKAPTVKSKTVPAAAPAAATVPAAAVPASKTKTAGCCARHGGVAKCNKSAGYLMCKDGTQSATCQCS